MAVPRMYGLHHFTLICKDVEESVRFYTEVLGAIVERERRPSVDAPGGYGPVGIQLGNVVIDLFQADENWQPYPGTYAQHYAFHIPWEEVDAWFAHMRAHGIQLAIHPTGDRSLSLYFSDPTGYHLELNLRGDPPFVREQCQRLMEKYGNPYYWGDGLGLPEGQPHGAWIGG